MSGMDQIVGNCAGTATLQKTMFCTTVTQTATLERDGESTFNILHITIVFMSGFYETLCRKY